MQTDSSGIKGTNTVNSMMRRTFGSLVVIVALVGTGRLHAQQAPAPVTNAHVDVVRPGDVVRIAVWRNEELSGDFEVAADGTLRHPFWRQLKVTDTSLGELDQRVRTLLSKIDATPEFVVQPLLRVSVGGDVKSPQLYSFPPEVTVGRAVALAGGPNEGAALDRAKLLRGGTERLFDVRNPNVGIAAEPIQSGDQIMLTVKKSTFRNVILPTASMVTMVLSMLNLYFRVKAQ